MLEAGCYTHVHLVLAVTWERELPISEGAATDSDGQSRMSSACPLPPSALSALCHLRAGDSGQVSLAVQGNGACSPAGIDAQRCLINKRAAECRLWDGEDCQHHGRL